MQRVAFVGVGGLGSAHVRNVAKIPNAKIVGIMDVREEQAKTLGEEVGAPYYTDFDKMMAEVECDVVYIATPTPWHHPYCIKAAKAKKHVITEKPLARTKEQCQEMIDVCKENGVNLFVAQVVRWFPEFVNARNQIEAGAIGKPAIIRTTRGGTFPRAWEDWYGNLDWSGGVTLDAIVHDFDWLLWTFGPAERVFCNGLYPRKLDHCDYSLTTIRFKSGAIAHVEGTWAHYDGFRVEFDIAGDKGLIEHKSRNNLPLTIVKANEDDAKVGVPVPESPHDTNPYMQEDTHFIDCLENGTECLVKPEQAMAAVEVALAALESAATGQPIFFGGKE